MPMRLFLLTGLFIGVICQQQSDDDSALHFSNGQNGRAVWIVDDSSLPWVGSYEYLSSMQSGTTVLMTVVDSSTGRRLGQCATESHGSKWVRFQWALASDSMQCTVSPTNSSRVNFPASNNPRTFSVRIQAGSGPACLRDMMVQNERPVGCPPHLARNSFSSLHLSCSCPYDAGSGEISNESGEPQFPLFSLGTPSSQTQDTQAWTVSPCAAYQCMHNGTCVVTQEGQATCLCENGFIGSQCEVDVCATVPCQNGGVCRANGGEAICECPAGYTGLLCESSVCNPACSNGKCIVANGTARCDCTQGFIGINCNVIDVCLGDAACAMFGENAKCVLEPSNYILHSQSLVNATYDCRCPHPDTGEFLDCLELHLLSVAPSSLATESPQFPELNIHGLPGLLPTTAAPVQEQTASQTMSPSGVPTRPTFSIHPVPQMPVTSFVPEQTFSTTPHAIPAVGVEEQTAVWTAIPSLPQTAQPVAQSTFVFPQTPQTTQPPMVEHQATHAITPQISEEEQSEEEEMEEEEEQEAATPAATFLPDPSSFPTPSPMEVVVQETTTVPQDSDVNPFHSLVTNTMGSPQEQQESSEDEFAETATSMGEMTTEMDYEEHEVVTEAPISTPVSMWSTEVVDVDVTSPESVDTPTTTIPTMHEITQEVPDSSSEETEWNTQSVNEETFTETPETTTIWHEITQEVPVEVTTQSTLPFWMFSTEAPTPTTQFVPQQPAEMPEEFPEPSEEMPTEMEVSESSEEYHEMTSMETTSTTPHDVDDQEAGAADRQKKSSAASWIVAIVALIVLGLLLLAASLFVLRYIKQSRKLHGKYNPAREEHALSAAYSMPMSHITKEERLI